MDTTLRAADADLAASLRHLRRLLRVGAVAVALTGLGLGLAARPAAAAAAGGRAGDVVITGIAAPQAPADTALTRKVNEYEGQHRLAGKVNEYEGQHRLAGKDPEVPVSPNLSRKVNEYEGQH